ncbi:hypothetical protein JHN49_28540, partial [Streptomyces sp. MBT57]|nr:hypothetical protein [Streptomyces sp. MBT57]
MTTQDYGTVPPPPAGPPEPPPGAGPAELLDHAEQLLEHHDAQERPEDAGNAWQRCREVLLRARDLLENEAAGADPAALARARFLLGLALSVGYWQASAGHAEAYGVSERLGVRSTAAGLLALARATLPQDTPAYATACVRHGLLLHDRFEGDDAEDDGEGEGEGPHAVGGADARDDDLDEAV